MNLIIDSLLILILIVCAYSDVTTSRIRNIVTLPAIGLGLVLNLLQNGIPGLLNASLGFFIGFGIFFIMFIFGGMGGGDVKLIAAIGAFKGYPFILDAMIYSIFAGGILSIFILIYKKALFSSLKHILRVVLTFLIPKFEIESLEKKNSHKIPFGFCIAVGTLLAMILNNVFDFQLMI